jgi:hypothetical protein
MHVPWQQTPPESMQSSPDNLIGKTSKANNIRHSAHRRQARSGQTTTFYTPKKPNTVAPLPCYPNKLLRCAVGNMTEAATFYESHSLFQIHQNLQESAAC